ncbi:hypothetical protein C7M61_001743 [Candidozyma pseudohaemuli]|uniref:YMC020W-like alpha/beta hydrolase domain-containing protein n=1 Tax=Candidozyma pseudohaemuli TaxID=418784 RepID=A0A2P7YVE6_9ASCO|nr:hypothetical protein C7M61_001743 [[Candida] pseudohaemulonii]PSK39932.1 hypothetical protein C7M61_001743 [[Candida] pseudohaemulonii]
MSSSWLPKWNSSSSSLPAKAEEQMNNPTLELNTDSLLARPNPSEIHTSASTGDLESKGRIKSHSPRKKSNLSKPLNHKASTSSLVSMSKGNWLSWGPKNRLGSESDSNDEKRDGDEDNNDEEDHLADNDENENESNSNDEIDDHVGHSNGNRKKLWSFWNGSNTSNGANGSDDDSKAKKEPEKPLSATNAIVSSTPSIPSKDDLFGGTNESTKEQAASQEEGNAAVTSQPDQSKPEDDAVLYKPHDSAKQFQKINTHKNENLKENIIVPDWRSCLHHQSSVRPRSSPDNLSSVPQSFDIKNWKGFLSHLSSRFGFGNQAQGDEEESEDGEQTQSIKEREFVSISERSYKLYGRSLSKLSHHKSSSLPSYGQQQDAGPENAPKRQKKLSGEDDDDTISITNDAMGNLLINNRGLLSARAPSGHQEAASSRAGPSKKIKKILIIGVHGFFPTRMIRPLIGSPTGTSLKFANEAEKAVIRYCVENDLINEREANSVSIQKIALEKEGKIFDRVEFFFEILKKWEKELNDADFIYIAAHSQGCVVSIILFAKLIKLGVLKNPNYKRIGLLGMAGINNGPFYGSDKTFFMKAYSAIEHNSLNELFELTKFDSKQSITYKESMQTIINANVKICFIGSINDQLVPLYSALASHIFHPNIYRACYIDHSSKTPAFIQKLVSLCCQLQNLGYFDNNVIKEISTVLAGPLTGGGHSKIYNDGKVYDLAIKFALCTDDIVAPPNTILTPSENAVTIAKPPVTNQIYVKEYNISKIGTNPYLLPWCLRGFIFNIEKNWPLSDGAITVGHALELRKSGVEEIDELYDLFDRWKPDSKVLKDLKFRLNGIRASKL